MEPSEMAFEGRGRSRTHRLMKGQRDEDQELAIMCGGGGDVDKSRVTSEQMRIWTGVGVKAIAENGRTAGDGVPAVCQRI